jgi:hypothetical protein
LRSRSITAPGGRRYTSTGRWSGRFWRIEPDGSPSSRMRRRRLPSSKESPLCASSSHARARAVGTIRVRRSSVPCCSPWSRRPQRPAAGSTGATRRSSGPMRDSKLRSMAHSVPTRRLHRSSASRSVGPKTSAPVSASAMSRAGSSPCIGRRRAACSRAASSVSPNGCAWSSSSRPCRVRPARLPMLRASSRTP